jgi:ribosomal protein S18 acetylase RimI-like enzyme
MEIRSLRLSEIESARLFLRASGWGHRVSDAKNFGQLIANSQRTAVAIFGGQIVGFARALCDDISNGYLSMLVVAPEHRRKGIGRTLVQFIVGTNPDITWVLRVGREAEASFLAKLGFARSAVAMERVRA